MGLPAMVLLLLIGNRGPACYSRLMHITIMRGLHDIAMVEPVSAEAKGADALILECIGTKQDKSPAEVHQALEAVLAKMRN
jgi:hypothetical protein